MRLPSLKAIQAFEAVARFGSFSRAADELAVTHGAVSRQVRSLEEQLGLTLFRRTPKGAELTGDGEILFRSANQAFTLLRDGVSELAKHGSGNTITVSLPTSLALKWLVPRLPEFRNLYPEISILLDTNDTIVDVRNGTVDVALRFGAGDWKGVHAQLLTSEELVAVASPALLRSTGVPENARALLELPLLHDDFNPGWERWFQSAGLLEDGKTLPGDRYRDTGVLIAAALDGQAAILVRRLLAVDDLAAGRLVQLSQRSLPLKHALYFVCRTGDQNRPVVCRFLAWLHSQLYGETEAITNLQEGGDPLATKP